MNTIVERVGWALLHSLWQGAVAWAALQAVLLTLRRCSAQARYLAACAALGFAVLGPAVTFFRYDLRQRLAVARAESVRPSHEAQATASPLSSARGVAPTSAIAATPAASPAWTELKERLRAVLPWLVFAWAIGCAGSWLRLVGAWRASAKLQRTATAPVSSNVAVVFDRICQRWGLTRDVRIGLCDFVDVPAVVGWLKPVILIPAGAFAGLSPIQVEALLAHELAHIRRHDFAVNLLQAVSEAVFYYHPAVHAINRAIRVFREEACDDAAVAATGDALGYAQALAALEAARVPNLAMAAARRDGELLSRIRRLLGLRVSAIDTTATVASGAMLAMLGYLALSVVAPALTAQVMTAQERVAAIRDAVPESWSERLPTVANTKGGKTIEESELQIGSSRYRGPVMHVQGTIVDETGAVVNYQGDLSAILNRERLHMALGIHVKAGRFDQEVPAGELSFASWPKGFAPLTGGPFLPSPGTDVVPPIVLTVKPGYSATLHVIDETGAPLPNVQLEGTIVARDPHGPHGGMMTPLVTLQSDAAGDVRIEHIDDRTEVTLTAKKEGCQEDARTFATFAPSSVVAWQLQTAKPAVGRVIDSATGAPVKGATILLAGKQVPGSMGPIVHGLQRPEDRNVLATTDDNGGFVVTSLNERADYRVFIEAPNYMLACEPLRAGATAEFRLSHGLTLSGVVRGASVADLTVNCDFELPVFAGHPAFNRRAVRVATQNGETAFRFDHLPPGEVKLHAGAFERRVRLSTDQSDLVVDVAAMEKQIERRLVTLRLKGHDNSAEPRGTIEAWVPTREGMNAGTEGKIAVIQNGIATLPDVFSGKIKAEPAGLIGYWFAPKDFVVPPGSGPVTFTLDLVPAGAIRGRVVDAEGKPPLLNVFVSCTAMEPVARDAVDGWTARWDDAASEPGRYTVTPLPLGGTYALVIWSGTHFTMSEPVKVSVENPLVTVDLKQAHGVTVTGRLLNPDGTPASVKKIWFAYRPTPSSSYSTSVLSEADGSFTLTDVNFDLPGNYELRIDSDRNRPLGSVKLTRATPQPIVVRLKSDPESAVANR